MAVKKAKKVSPDFGSDPSRISKRTHQDSKSKAIESFLLARPVAAHQQRENAKLTASLASRSRRRQT